MSVRSNRFSRVAVFGVIAAVCLAANLRSVHAEILTIDTALSSISVQVGVGLFLDGQGGTVNEETGLPYAPGDVGPGPDPEDPTPVPVTFANLASSIGQGDPSVIGYVAPGGVVPVYSDGSAASLNGTVSVTPAGFQINGTSVGLNVSGLWQPSNPLDTNGPPVPSELGVFLDLNNAIPGAYAIARLTGTNLNLTTGPVSIDGFGNFVDPNGVVTLVSSNVIGFAALPPIFGGPQALNTAITNEVTSASIQGTYTEVGPLKTLIIPNLVATSYVSAGDSLPGFYIALTQTSNIVATLVPEPSTIALAGFGLVGLVFAGYRRTRK